ncbi:preprotein translocase subunit SecE [Ruminococcaceae bacterium OttesenSCG-928-D13]|nr:preprotein translocase subunit SecE [Ruminococcaceae bacterium OttesenSCG-928-D13]
MAEKTTKKPNFLVRAGRAIARFFKDTRGEMKKVVWPSRKQVWNNFLVVMGFVIICAVLIAGLDFLFAQIFRGIVLLTTGTDTGA